MNEQPTAACGRNDARNALASVLAPRSVAVVGVSQDPLKYGSRLARSICDTGYDGELYFVNPRAGRFLDLDFQPSLDAIGKPVDLVLVAVPSTHCPGTVADAGRLGCGAAVIVSNGFAEAGAGALQEELARSAAQAGIRFIGPNCMGVYSAPGNLNLVGDPTLPKGRVAVVTQSGNVGIAVYQAAKRHGLGLSYFISMGNQADIAFGDVLAYLEDDPHSDVVLLYVEGFRHLTQFLSAAASLAAVKPVVILRGGRSAAGARAAASHTGAMADDDLLVAAALRAAGVVEVQTPTELFLAALAYSDDVPLKGRSVSVVADSGGYATLGADAAARAGLRVDEHRPALQEKLRQFLWPQASVGNPVDTIGGPDILPDVFQRAVGACFEDNWIDGVLLVGAFGGYGDFDGPVLIAREEAAAEDLVAAKRRAGKPLVVQSIYAAEPHRGMDTLRRGGIPVVERLDEAMQLMMLKARRGETGAAPVRRQWPASAHQAVGRPLPEDESRAWLAARLPGLVPVWQVVHDEEAAVAGLRAHAKPVVLKALSPRLIHKSDKGGVLLNLATEEQVRDAWRQVERVCAKLSGPPRALMCLYETGAIEALVGVFRHAELGPVVMVGSGGIFAEAVSDRAVLFPPFGENEALHALMTLQLGRKLDSPRCPPAALTGLLSLSVAVGDLAAAEDSLIELDLNPVLLGSGGATILDVRVVTT